MSLIAPSRLPHVAALPEGTNMFIHDVFLLRLRELGEEHAACGGTFGLGIRLLKLLPAGVVWCYGVVLWCGDGGGGGGGGGCRPHVPFYLWRRRRPIF